MSILRANITGGLFMQIGAIDSSGNPRFRPFDDVRGFGINNFTAASSVAGTVYLVARADFTISTCSADSLRGVRVA